MRCHSCDYELWHCTGRTCPECGDEFSLQDYVFEKDQVLFHCPHCDHGIQGTTQDGLPRASIEQCEECGRGVGLKWYIVRPIDPHTNNSFGVRLPNRTTQGNWFTRYFRTVWLVMTHPQIAIGRVPVQEPLIHAWTFFLTTLCITLLIGMIPVILFFLLVSSGSGSVGMRVPSMVVVIALQGVIGAIVVVLYIFLWSLVTHGMLQMTGGSAFTLRRTMQSILYGGGASLANIVPCIGGFAGGIWWIVSSINMVKRGQRVDGGRASFATLMTPVICFFCVCGGYLLIIFSLLAPAMSNARSMVQQAQQQASQGATQMTPAVSSEQPDQIILDQP